MADRIGSFVADLVAARDELMAAVQHVEPSRLTAPGLVGEWSARELLAHLGYWAGHAVDQIQAAERGEADTFGLDERPVDDVNATVARVARGSEFATVQARERASFEVLVERIGRLDPTLLDLRLAEGETLERAIDADGATHYREHAGQLRGTLAR